MDILSTGNDVFEVTRAFPANYYATKILEYLAKRVGTLTMFFGSCHIYLDF